MQIYQGQSVIARMRAVDPVTQKIIADGGGTAYFFASPKNPQANPADRGSPDVTVAMSYDPVARYYLATTSSAGWAAGTWWLRCNLAGGSLGYNAWDYFPFTVLA